MFWRRREEWQESCVFIPKHSSEGSLQRQRSKQREQILSLMFSYVIGLESFARSGDETGSQLVVNTSLSVNTFLGMVAKTEDGSLEMKLSRKNPKISCR